MTLRCGIMVHCRSSVIVMMAGLVRIVRLVFVAHVTLVPQPLSAVFDCARV